MAKGDKFIAGLVAGTFVGAIVGLLAAPKPGKETRKVVGAKAEDLKTRAEDYFTLLRERFNKSDQTEEDTLIEGHSGNGVHSYD